MRATTIRFTDDLYARLEASSKQLGLPINSIVVFACLSWLGGAPAHLARAPIEGLQRADWRPGHRWQGTHKYPFELFSAAAKLSLLLSQEEAERLRSRAIGTDHLLLGLIRSELGVAAALLGQFGVREADARAGLGPAAGAEKPARMLPTSRVKRVLQVAVEESRTRQLSYVGTEHLLLGIVGIGEGRAAAYLAEHGVTEAAVRDRLGNLAQEA